LLNRRGKDFHWNDGMLGLENWGVGGLGELHDCGVSSKDDEKEETTDYADFFISCFL
jgi:hypothetical protein